VTRFLREIILAVVAVGLLTLPLHADSMRQPAGPDEGPGTQEEGAGASEDGATELSVVWEDGLRFRTEDGAVELRIGGRVHQDWTFWSEGGALERLVGGLDSGNEFRRARIHLQGVLGDAVEFKLQYDFAGGDAALKDVYLGTTGHRVDLRMGHFKEPFSLEEMTSSNDSTFVERALPNVFAPARNAGFMVHGTVVEERAWWAAGLFRESDDFGLGQGDDYNLTGRLAGIAWDREDLLVHLGASLGYRNVDADSTLRFRQRPEVHLSPRFVDTGVFPAESAALLGAEAALVAGAFSAQGEYIRTAVASAALGDPALDGYYVFGSFLLTGESRSYRGGVFRGVAPRRDFLTAGGPGAWEVALRLSGLDLDDGLLAGGELTDLTLGVNWYWNANLRMMFDVTRAERSGVDEATAFVWRGQLDL